MRVLVRVVREKIPKDNKVGSMVNPDSIVVVKIVLNFEQIDFKVHNVVIDDIEAYFKVLQALVI